MSLTRWKIFAGIGLLVFSTAATALSLGRVRGTALIGRVLDLSVQATLEGQEATPEPACFAVELFYGDTRISPNAVSFIPERTAGGELRIRVRSSVAVDEPVVTLFVRASCGASVSRRYVLLAEALTESADPSVGFTQPNTPSFTPPRTSTSGGQASNPLAAPVEPRQAFGGAQSASAVPSRTEPKRAERASQRRAQRATVPDASLEAEPKVAKSAVPASVVRKPAAQTQGAPRLQLDLLDLTNAPLNLRGSAEIVSAPSSDEAVRRQAQALWRMLNASPEEAMQEVQRLDKLEAQTRASQEQSKRQAAEITSLAAQLETAKKERYLNPLTITLGLLTLAALAFVIWFWRRGSSTGKPWWGSNASKAAPQDEQHLWGHLADSAMADLPGDAQKKGSLVAEASPTSYFSALNSNQNTPQNDRDVNKSGSVFAAAALANAASKTAGMPDFNRSSNAHPTAETVNPSSQRAALNGVKSVGRLNTAKPAGSQILSSKSAATEGRSGFGQSDFAPSTYSAPRLVAAEELFDIQEQADFFLSLNQPEQAIEVLKNHITENVETSALAYMDLFDIYHNAGMQKDYADLRDEFNRVFNADVPEFASYGARSNGLEDFPKVLTQIQQTWHRPQQAQDVIEESIFRQPEQDQQPLDMTAYRELMLLYALAKELGRPDSGYSKLPISSQIPVQTGGAASPDIDLGEGLMLSSPDLDMLSAKDQTMSLPHPLILPKDGAAKAEDGLDFDLSDSAALGAYKLPGAKKKS
jgi:pilus assembly protein FimV